MSITINCTCSAQLEAPDEFAGAGVKCPACKIVLKLPIPEAIINRAANTISAGYNSQAFNGKMGAASFPATQTNSPPDPARQSSDRHRTREHHCREDGDIPADLRDRLRGMIMQNEQLCWIGSPVVPWLWARSLMRPVVTLGGFAVGATYFLARLHASDLILLGPFAIFVPILCALAALKWRNCSRTCYALTTRRAIVLKQELFGMNEEVYSAQEVSRMRRQFDIFNVGDLVFHSVHVVEKCRNQIGMEKTKGITTTDYGFLAIKNVDEIERLVRETLIDRLIDRLTEASNF